MDEFLAGGMLVEACDETGTVDASAGDLASERVTTACCSRNVTVSTWGMEVRIRRT